jgi:uncharacterized repeat protein (TIGR01451 family)/LPXTG-motif cell wall-anchored protein
VGQIVSTAMVTPPSDTVDVTPDDNRAVDIDAVTPVFALTITKVAATVDVTPGASLDYTIVVSNAGPSTATDVVVSDRMPAELTPVSWTCAGAQAATCAAGSGSGVPSVVVRIPAGGSVTLGVRTIVSNDLIQATEIVNVAVATVGSSANLAGTEATASAMVRVTPPAQPVPVQPVTPETPATPVAPAPSAPATAVPDPAPETTPTTPTTPSEPLASTGSDAASLVVAAAIATLLGMVLVVGTRRRHRQVT